MSMLDSVIDWSDNSITCVTSTHRHASNPLMVGANLPSLCLIEYGAQAAAVHAALVANRVDGQGKPAYIGNLKNIEWKEALVDSALPTLTITANLVASSASGAIYDIEASAEQETLLTASMTLIMRA